MLNIYKNAVVGNFNIHIDTEGDSSNAAFKVIGFTGFTQRILSPNYFCHHTLDLLLTYGIECEDITVLFHNPGLSDHFY